MNVQPVQEYAAVPTKEKEMLTPNEGSEEESFVKMAILELKELFLEEKSYNKKKTFILSLLLLLNLFLIVLTLFKTNKMQNVQETFSGLDTTPSTTRLPLAVTVPATSSLNPTFEPTSFPSFSRPSSEVSCGEYLRSTKFVEGCTHNNGRKFPILISGVPRSGTMRTASLLQNLGIDIVHDFENVKSVGAVSWILAFRQENPYHYYGPVVFPAGDAFNHVFHQVREPLACITSIACTEPWYKTHYQNFVSSNVDLKTKLFKNKNGDLSPQTKFGLSLRMFVQYHEFLDKISDLTFRMEDVNVTLLKKIIQMANIEMPSEENFAKLNLGEKINARRHRKKISWKDLFAIDKNYAKRAQKLALKYGYEISENDRKMDTKDWNIGHISCSDFSKISTVASSPSEVSY